MKIEKVKVSINLKAGLEIEKVVTSWEAHLLGAIHGDENVQQLSSSVEDGEFDPKLEWEGLVRKYGTATNEEGKAIVRVLWPNPFALGSYFDRTAPRQRNRQPAEQAAA